MEKQSIAKIWEEHIRGEGYDAPTINAAYLDKLPRLSMWRDLLGRYAKKHHRFLEAGIGSGEFLLCASMYVKECYGLDYVHSVLRQAQDIYARAREFGAKVENPRLLRADLFHPAISPNSMDIVYNNGVVEHWLDRNERIQIMRKMADMAKPGALVIIVVPNGKHPFMEKWRREKYPGYFDGNVVPFHFYDLKELEAEGVESGLDILESGGLFPWQAFNAWPKSRWKALLCRVAAKLLPMPASFGKRYGMSLYIVGKKTREAKS